MPLVQRRIGILFAVFLGLLALAGLRGLYLGAVKGGGLANAASSQQTTVTKVPAQRGTITDRKRIPLATSEPADDISATPYLIKDPVAAANRLAPLIGMPADELVTKLARRDTGFVYLRRGVPASAADRIRALKIEGIDFAPGILRRYPRGSLAAQVVGATGLDGKGLFGLEYSYDKLLHGRDGERRKVMDAARQPIEVDDLARARPGRPVRLTLDAEVQQKTEEVLAKVTSEYAPKGATAIVMDPETREVLAMANTPQVDLNRPGEAPDGATQNRAVGMTYEPGSTFKPFTVAAALEDRVVTPDTQFNLAPTIQVADRVIGESHGRGWETMSTATILAHSSNVGTITIGMKLGAKRFDSWMRRFGFGRQTGVGLPGEEQGLVLNLKDYSGSTMGNLPMGQGQLVTPIQMMAGYAALASDGTLRKPRIVLDGAKNSRPDQGTRLVSEKTAAQIRQMLTGVFAEGGTASEVSVPGYELAGKTGTANKIDPSTGEYSKEKYVASFVGMAPAKDPKLLIGVFVDEPSGDIYGGSVAAPAFGEIAKFALPYMRVSPN
ncbi:MAG: peptidoglycan D,D-transpeptidase FtsI family protein [Solirubrobacterales bacterium]